MAILCYNSDRYRWTGGVEVGKATRLIQLTELLTQRKSFTARELADEFGVSYRTMLRDLAALEEIGVPLYSELGAHGGYRVLTERNMRPIQWGAVSTKQLDKIGLKAKRDIEPQIATKPKLHVVGIQFTGTFSQLVDHMLDVWNRFLPMVTVIPNVVDSTVWLDVAQENLVTDTYTQLVAVQVSSFMEIPQGMVGLTIPSQTYAVFTHVGPMSEVQNTYYGAFKWIDENGLKRITDKPRFELYDSRYNPANHSRSRPENAYDIYISIELAR